MYPALRVRRLTRKEGKTLLRIVRRSSDKVAVKRAAMVLAAKTGMTAPQISRSQFVHETYVRKTLNAFNAEGLAAIGNRYGKGRPRIFTAAVRAEIFQVVTTPPPQLGLPFTVWSVPKLHEYLMAHQIVPPLSPEWLRQILLEAGVTSQRTKTWKQSPDVDYLPKKDGSGGTTRMPRRVASA